MLKQHTLLLQRLHAEISLDGSALDWFSSYLSCRSQQVLVGHALWAETPLLCGIPQGSMLGPLLFSLYTRQLADLIDKFCIDYHFFADDSELYSCLPTEPESALSVLRNVESCCRQIKIWTTKKKTETQWAKKLKYSSVDHHLEEKLSVLTAFQLAKCPFHSPMWWKHLE